MKFILKIIMLMVITSGFSQELDKNSFDFWLGEWDLTWTNKEGETKKGTNKVIKILDGQVIQENFEDLQTGFKGMSLSVYNQRNKEWHQAWADNGGGYFNFYGTQGNDGVIFRTNTEEIQEHKVIRRMVFKNVTRDSLIWDWEISLDNGKTWTLKWRINYKRK